MLVVLCFCITTHSDVQNFPDFQAMLTVGSVFYGMMFIVTYPMFHQFEAARGWSFNAVVSHALLASGLVWALFEAWAFVIGPISEAGGLHPPLE